MRFLTRRDEVTETPCHCNGCRAARWGIAGLMALAMMWMAPLPVQAEVPCETAYRSVIVDMAEGQCGWQLQKTTELGCEESPAWHDEGPVDWDDCPNGVAVYLSLFNVCMRVELYEGNIVAYSVHNNVGSDAECQSLWGDGVYTDIPQSWGDGVITGNGGSIIEKDINVAWSPVTAPDNPGDFLPTRWHAAYVEYGAIQFCVGWSESRWPSSRGLGQWFLDGGSVYTFPGLSQSDCADGVGVVQPPVDVWANDPGAWFLIMGDESGCGGASPVGQTLDIELDGWRVPNGNGTWSWGSNC